MTNHEGSSGKMITSCPHGTGRTQANRSDACLAVSIGLELTDWLRLAFTPFKLTTIVTG